MAKKFGKLVIFSALAGAAAAGTYYYLQKKNDNPFKDTDDIDDFDDFDDDIEDDFEDTTSHNNSKNRAYVSLDLDSAKEIIGEKVIETLDKTKEKIEQFNVSEKIDKAKEIIEEMTAPTPESNQSHVDVTPVAYTSPLEKEDDENHASVSATYTSDGDISSENASNTSVEEFFDDTEEGAVKK